jgi:hypothetical protein
MRYEREFDVPVEMMIMGANRADQINSAAIVLTTRSACVGTVVAAIASSITRAPTSCMLVTASPLPGFWREVNH